MGDTAKPVIRVERFDGMMEGWWVQLDEVIDRHQVIPLVTCSVLLDAFQQSVGLAFIPFCLQHDFGQGRWMGQVPIPSLTGFTLLLGSRGASGVNHPRKTKQRFRQGW